MNGQATDPVQVLDRVVDLFAQERWMQGQFCSEPEGEIMDPTTCFCMTGALRQAVWGSERVHISMPNPAMDFEITQEPVPQDIKQRWDLFAQSLKYVADAIEHYWHYSGRGDQAANEDHDYVVTWNDEGDRTIDQVQAVAREARNRAAAQADAAQDQA